MTSERPLSASFRDPSGFLFRRGNVLYRQVGRRFQPSYDHLMGSGLHRRLVDQKILVPHEETADQPAEPQSAYKVLRPEPVPFISYPYEWCFSQLKDAALLTLQAQRTALEHGMELKDASAYNAQFLDGKLILIDTLSFQLHAEGAPWVAYRQFCQHFLSPLALMSRRDERLGRLSQLHLDGIPLDLACALIPRTAWLSPGLFLHLRLHAAAQQRLANRTPSKARGMSRQALLGLADSLERTVRALRPRSAAGEWADYYAKNSPESTEQKKRAVARFLDEVSPTPRTVWDLGANTGLFSRLASGRGIFTLAWDADAGCVEKNYRESVSAGERNLLPLILDLTNPSPAAGWANQERDSWLERAPADAVLALAIVHHLAIGNQTPLRRVAELMARLGRWLIIEFVPKEDPQARALLVRREDVFPDYTRPVFEKVFGELFRLRGRQEIPGTQRTLYLMEKF